MKIANTTMSMPCSTPGTGGSLPRLAVVEDDPDQRHSMLEYLEFHNYPVWAEPSAERFYRRLLVNPADIVILDLGLPGEDGLHATRHIAQLQLGVIVVSARSSLDNRLDGLRSGADSYLVKPINLTELVAQIEALWRRLQQTRPDRETATSNAWVLSQNSRELRSPSGGVTSVTPSEFALLRSLARSGGSLSRKEIASVLDRNPEQFNFHRIDVLLTRLRKKVQSVIGATLPIASAPPQRLELTSPLLLD